MKVQNGEIHGYGVIRKCRKVYKIGPLFADNFDIAEKLFQKLVSCAGDGTSIFLDTPEVNKAAIKLAKISGMKPVFETARMYTKKEPDIDIGKVFGVTSFELG